MSGGMRGAGGGLGTTSNLGSGMLAPAIQSQLPTLGANGQAQGGAMPTAQQPSGYAHIMALMQQMQQAKQGGGGIIPGIMGLMGK